MIVIADTSPLNYIIQLGLIEELHTIYGDVIVPTAVREEMQHPRSPDAVRSWSATLPEWAELRRPRELDRTLPPNLGSGEREAISLAIELHASMLLIDDLPGRMAAKERHIQFTGTLAILFQAALMNNLDYNLKIEELRLLGFRATDAVLETMKGRFKSARGPNPNRK